MANDSFLTPSLQKNDRRANILIIAFSVIVFLVVAALGRFHLQLHLPFNVHIFAVANAVINSIVSILLIIALAQVKAKKYAAHRRTMYVAMVLSILFLVSYIAHHLLAGDTSFGGTGIIRPVYFVLLATHIILAATILPFILFTAYRGMTGEYEKHKKLSKYTWPLWLYVSLTGPIVYLLISPYYH